jgi:large subunit ribosomal protein L14e
MINDIGRVCVKIAGRDAGMRCAVVDVLDNNNVLIDGLTRRRKCNILHLEPTEQMLNIEKGASHPDVVAAFKSLGVEIKEKAAKAKEKKEKPSKKRISTKAAEEATGAKKPAKGKKAAEKKKK